MVVPTAMAMGSKFVWKSNTELVVSWRLTSAGWRRPALAHDSHVCDWVQAGPEAAAASGSSWRPSNLLSPLCQPGPERTHGPGPRRERGRQPLPAKQTCSLHIHFIKTNVFLEFLLASSYFFCVGLRTEGNQAVSGRNTEKYGAFQDNSIAIQACVHMAGDKSDWDRWVRKYAEKDSSAPLWRKWWVWKRSDEAVAFL